MSQSNQEELIAVVGTGCRFPGGCDTPSKLWDLLKDPKDLLTAIPKERFDAKAWYHPDNKHHGTSNVRSAYFLDQDPAAFDNEFFNIQSSEAEAVDPQQRILLETVYDSLCEAGYTIEGLKGSSTAVYVGLMCDDWSAIVSKDAEVFPQYAATGTSRSVMSNRVSYFFDWHGPSMTIDTACSSSLVAVHQGISALRSGESNVAIAAGANLILSPEMFIAESKLSMLSANGRSRMWDKDVDGYARGEGIAAVVLKRLSDAVRDNDQIECVIRATSVNQDGRTPGLTMPSGTAQAALIRDTYARAGLDITKSSDRPQFFHAHGTGTAAGDPQEAKAIHEAFYLNGNGSRNNDKLYVGSVKTVIGHTEGTAGLASLISTSLAMRHKIIPPNMHFENLNPRLKPYYGHLEVPTKALEWPEPEPGQPRRASVNSFGFGGTNAHAIIEEYRPEIISKTKSQDSTGPLVTPLVFSAASESSLKSLLSSYSEYLKANPETSLPSLAYTLQARRSTLHYRVAINASSVSDLVSRLDAIVAGQEDSTIATRQLSKTASKVLAVFTGQGAQWARMGARLVETTPFALKRLKELDEALVTAAAGNAPNWTLSEMILADASTSRVAEAAISQPLCTAVQIVLVDLLRQAGIKIDAVVGHSSGEIGAAYASGLYSARDAIRAAYYRGLYSKLAKSPNGGKGSMCAVGTTHEDALELCELEKYEGRLQVAAVNSFNSVTLSGDEEAVAEACEIYQDEGVFARQLKVDTAYHSSHVLPCSAPYLDAMITSGRDEILETDTHLPTWYSSVLDGQEMAQEDVQPQYWVDNMTNPVLFSTAVEAACANAGPFDLIIEIGPHPALQKPCLDTVEEITGTRPPYTGVLGRGKDDAHEFSKALGFIWTRLGPQSVAFDKVEIAASAGASTVPTVLKDLPSYPFDHSSKFLALSRVSGLYNRAHAPTHPLLGKRCYDRETNFCLQWRNVLSIKEVPWLTGHQIQGLAVFPAAGFISMAIEAIVALAKDIPISLLSLENVDIGRAMAFQDESSRVEVLFDVRINSQTSSEIVAEWACYSGDPHDIKSVLALNASGTIRASLSKDAENVVPDALPLVDIANTDDLNPVDTERFYKFLRKLGYQYSWPFYGTNTIQRKADYATGMLEDQSGDNWEDQLLVHPGVIDTALQTAFAAYCCPGDERLWSLHVPTSFKSIVINPFFTAKGIGKQKTLEFVSTAADLKQGKIAAELNLISKHEGQSYTFLQAEGLELVPIAAAVPDNDIVLFSRFDYRLAYADGKTAVADTVTTASAASGENEGSLKVLDQYLANMVAQLSHRYPRMNILQVDAEVGGSTQTVLEKLGSAFETFTFTGASDAEFAAAENQFSVFGDRLNFKTLNLSESPSSQGFKEGTYDLIISAHSISPSSEMQESLAHLRQLVKPGGFAIIATPVKEQWDKLLKNAGFSGVDTDTSSHHNDVSGVVICTQALDDRIKMLRSPLDNIAVLPTNEVSQLTIIGYSHIAELQQLRTQISRLLSPSLPSAKFVDAVEQVTADTIPSGGTVVMLAELGDSPWESLDPAKLEGIKNIYRQAHHLLWVTSGAESKNPHANISLGIGRAMQFEYPHLNLQALDLDIINDKSATIIAEHVLCLTALDSWKQDDEQPAMLWSMEPEVWIKNGVSIIPRLYPYNPGNDRYNTSRRAVRNQVAPEENNLAFTNDKDKWEVQVTSPLHQCARLPYATATRKLRVLSVLLSTLSMAAGATLLPVIVEDVATTELLLALSPTSESVIEVPSSWTVPIKGQESNSALVAVAANILARQVAKLTHSGDILIVHDPHPTVAKELARIADESSFSVVFTTPAAQTSIEHGWLYIGAMTPTKKIQGLLPNNATSYLDLSQTVPGSGANIALSLPRKCRSVNTSGLVGTTTELQPWVLEEDIAAVLKQSASEVLNDQQYELNSSSLSAVPIDSLSDLAHHSSFTIANCSVPSVTARVHAIDEGTIFRNDKTYLLVGLTGEIGKSLCKWMAERGARHIVLTSRSPKENHIFINAMKALGADVRLLPMDVRSRDSVRACYETIKQTLPPVAGVANGAMILHDMVFDNMPFEVLDKVLAPKVVGSQLLDELFYDTPLDFFIFFSSMTAVLGNSGQANYIAGNMFMNALAAQRKKRGVAGSSINISSVIGVGYVERSDQLDEEYFSNMGYRPMSEQDLQISFAEAIVLGKPECKEIAELSTGIKSTLDAQSIGKFLQDIKFSTMMMHKSNDTAALGGGVSAAPLKVQLADAQDKADVFSIIKTVFLARLRRILSIPAEKNINEDVTLVEQGVDSLMAVEVRTFFNKELDVDIPVLKILGDISINDILNQVVDLLPDSITAPAEGQPKEKSSKVSMSQPAKATTPAAPTLLPAPDRNDLEAGNTTASSTTDDSSKDVSREDSEVNETPLESPVRTPDIRSKSTAFSHLLGEKELRAVNALVASARLTSAPEDAKATTLTTSQPSKKEIKAPMSSGQEGFWFLQDYLTNKSVFNTSVMLKLDGAVQKDNLNQALQIVTRRHEILRTRFLFDEQNGQQKAMQAISPSANVKLETKSIVSEAQAQEEFSKLNQHEFDLNNGEAVRVILLSLSEKAHFLTAAMHHIYLDGYSFSVFFSDLETAYTSKRLPPLPLASQYRSFVEQERATYESGGYEETISHYRETLPSDFEPVQLLPFAKSATRTETNSYDQTESTLKIESQLANKVRQMARNNRSTSFHVYLGAFQALLFQLLPDTDDLIIGMGDANRDDKQFLKSIGYFFNLLPLHFRRSASSGTLSQLVQATRSEVRGALERPHVPFGLLLDELDVPRSNKHAPLVQICIDHRQVQQEQSNWGGCKVSGEQWHDASTGFDISLQITEFNTDCSLSLRLQKSLYNEQQTDLLLRSFISVLEYMVDAPETELAEGLPTWSQQDVQDAITVGNGREFQTRWDSRPPTLVHRIDEMIKLHQNRTALKDGHGHSLTYHEMGRRISTIVAALLEQKAARGDVIGVFQEPTTDWICSMIAILRIGATYLALDQRLSLPRLATIVETAKPAAILTDDATYDKVGDICAKSVSTISVSKVVTSTNSEFPNQALPGDVAVTLFTSGSTGVPKGMRMTHSNLVFSTDSISRAFEVSEESVILQQSPFSFDPSLCQTFLALTSGASLYVVPASSRGDPLAISKIMAEEKVTLTVGTPREYGMLFEYGAQYIRQCHAWRCAAWGGEQMPHTLAQQLAASGLDGLKAYNVYGPSETTMLSNYQLLNPREIKDNEYIPVGVGFDGYKFAIVDSQLRPQPVGVPGEIIIGGPAVVAGYLSNKELTDAKFLQDTFFGTGSTVYRSGDRGRLLSDGTLLIEGRLDGDDMIKLRGFRIELEEIERAIIKQADGVISEAIVSLRGEGDAQFLAAHVTLTSELSSQAKANLVTTLQNLPLSSYMKPSVIGAVNAIPKTVHDKVDRKAAKKLALPSAGDAASLSRHDSQGHVQASLSDTERDLGDLWRQVIPVYVGALTPNSDFFLTGGNSLLLVKLQALIREKFHATPKLMDLMGASSLASMAEVVQKDTKGKVYIDWELETRPPAALQEKLRIFNSSLQRSTQVRRSNGSNVLLIGATGQLGRNVLSQLASSSKVGKVICLSRKPDESEAIKKTINLQGDVSQTNLGLSDDEYQMVLAETDVILHCAANRSFWDRYEVLKPLNVGAIANIVNLIAETGRTIPLHVMSSGAVFHYDIEGASPPVDGSDGYVSTKWAAEMLLKRIAADTSIPIYIHRPSGLDGHQLGSERERDLVTDQLMNLVISLQIQPEFGGVDGTLDIITTESMARFLSETVVESLNRAMDVDGSERNVIYQSDILATLRVYAREFATRLEKEGEHHQFPKMGILEWFGEAKKAGFRYIIAAQELTMTSGNDTIITRR